MNVKISNTYDVDVVSNRIWVRFVGHIDFLGKSAEQVSEGIRCFKQHCEHECSFLSHRENAEITSQSPNNTWTYPVNGGMKMQWNCTPMQAFADQGDRDAYIEHVLKRRGYTSW